MKSKNHFERYYYNTYYNVYKGQNKIILHGRDLEFNLEHKMMLELLGAPKNKTIVDLGCNDGTLLSRIRKKFPDNRLIGLDVSKSALRIAKLEGFECYFCDATEKIPLKNESADIIISTCVIAHIFETEKFLKEVSRVLKKNGCYIITTPNFNGLRDMLKYVFLGDTPTRIDHEHIRLFNPKLLTSYFKKAGLRPEVWNCYTPVLPLKVAEAFGIRRYIKTNFAKTFLSNKLVVKAVKED